MRRDPLPQHAPNRRWPTRKTACARCAPPPSIMNGPVHRHLRRAALVTTVGASRGTVCRAGLPVLLPAQEASTRRCRRSACSTRLLAEAEAARLSRSQSQGFSSAPIPVRAIQIGSAISVLVRGPALGTRCMTSRTSCDIVAKAVVRDMCKNHDGQGGVCLPSLPGRTFDGDYLYHCRSRRGSPIKRTPSGETARAVSRCIGQGRWPRWRVWLFAGIAPLRDRPGSRQSRSDRRLAQLGRHGATDRSTAGSNSIPWVKPGSVSALKPCWPMATRRQEAASSRPWRNAWSGGDYRDAVGQVGRERKLASRRSFGHLDARVAGYTVRARRYFGAEFTSRIENIGSFRSRSLGHPTFHTAPREAQDFRLNCG